jgi:hypothetical protein
MDYLKSIRPTEALILTQDTERGHFSRVILERLVNVEKLLLNWCLLHFILWCLVSCLIRCGLLLPEKDSVYYQRVLGSIRRSLLDLVSASRPFRELLLSIVCLGSMFY